MIRWLKMIRWFDKRDNSRLVISPRDFLRDRGFDESTTLPETVVMFHTGSAMPHIAETYSIEKYPFALPGFLSNPPVYRLQNLDGVALVQGGYGAPAAACLFEAAIALGCRRLLAFGLAGGVAREVMLADLVLPTEIVREEGTSFHYVSDNDNARPDPILLGCLRSFLAGVEGLDFHEGKTVSTDAAFRQTVSKELRWRQEGVLAVEMEMSALLTVARYHTIPAVSLLVISDKHDLEGDTPWTWDKAGMREGRTRGIDLMIGFARMLAVAGEL
jgi:uridine phosphorylase